MASAAPPVNRPRVTVLVAAYDRREFLLRAVRSVLASSAPREAYEIVVVKNFRNPEIDGFLAQQGAQVLQEGAVPVGAYMARALSVARGGVVCLLNDDDEFLPTKIAAVLERFDADPNLVYYHDRRILVDEDGRPLPTASRFERVQGAPFELRTDADRRSRVGRVHRFRGLFHDSCISVRRDVLDRHADRLAEVGVSEDAFTYYSALAAPGTLYFDNRAFTRFRVHAQSKYRLEKTGPRDPAVQAKRWRLIASLEAIVAGTAAERALAVFRIVTVHQAYLEVAGERRPTAGQYWELFVCFARYRVPSHAVLLVLSALKTVAPTTTGRFFARFWSFLDDPVT
jgi:glycosyltransferase involved in cell wall biosynthesis